MDAVPGCVLFYRLSQLWGGAQNPALEAEGPGTLASLRPKFYRRRNAVTVSEVAPVGDSRARLRPGLESCCPDGGPELRSLTAGWKALCLLTSRVSPGKGVHCGWGLTAAPVQAGSRRAPPRTSAEPPSLQGDVLGCQGCVRVTWLHRPGCRHRCSCCSHLCCVHSSCRRHLSLQGLLPRPLAGITGSA